MKRTEKIEIRLTKLEKEKFLEMQVNLGYSNLSEMVRHLILNKRGIKMTEEFRKMKWKDVMELARYFAEVDYLSGIEPDSWEKKNALRELEDALRMNSIWNKYRGTNEEYAVMQFFIKEYKKELERLYKEA